MERQNQLPQNLISLVRHDFFLHPIIRRNFERMMHLDLAVKVGTIKSNTENWVRSVHLNIAVGMRYINRSSEMWMRSLHFTIAAEVSNTTSRSKIWVQSVHLNEASVMSIVVCCKRGLTISAWVMRYL